MDMLVGDPASFQGRVCPPSQNLSHRIAATEMCYANRKIIEKEGKPYRTFNASPNRASRCHARISRVWNIILDKNRAANCKFAARSLFSSSYEGYDKDENCSQPPLSAEHLPPGARHDELC